MFKGFNISTIKYFELMEYQNDKEIFSKNQILYREGIQQPLEELYYELANFFSAFDSDLITNKRKCISSPYNDARFCKERPMKEYLYVRFKVNRLKKENTIGFFFDASKTNFKYGLNIYSLNSRGMEMIRNEILHNKKIAKRLIEQFDRNHTMRLAGMSYIKDNFLGEEIILKSWLNMRSMSFYHKEEINPVFFERTLLNDMYEAYTDMKNIYLFLKNALA